MNWKELRPKSNKPAEKAPSRDASAPSAPAASSGFEALLKAPERSSVTPSKGTQPGRSGVSTSIPKDAILTITVTDLPKSKKTTQGQDTPKDPITKPPHSADDTGLFDALYLGSFPGGRVDDEPIEQPEVSPQSVYDPRVSIQPEMYGGKPRESVETPKEDNASNPIIVEPDKSENPFDILDEWDRRQEEKWTASAGRHNTTSTQSIVVTGVQREIMEPEPPDTRPRSDITHITGFDGESTNVPPRKTMFDAHAQKVLAETKPGEQPPPVMMAFGNNGGKYYFQTNLEGDGANPLSIHSWPKGGIGPQMLVEEIETERAKPKVYGVLNFERRLGRKDDQQEVPNWADTVVEVAGNNNFEVMVLGSPVDSDTRAIIGKRAQVMSDSQRSSRIPASQEKVRLLDQANGLADRGQNVWVPQVIVSAEDPLVVKKIQGALHEVMRTETLDVTARPELVGSLKAASALLPVKKSDTLIETRDVANLFRYPNKKLPGFEHYPTHEGNEILPDLDTSEPGVIRLGRVKAKEGGIKYGPEIGDLNTRIEDLQGLIVVGMSGKGKSAFLTDVAKGVINEGLQVTIMSTGGAEDYRVLPDRTGKDVVFYDVVPKDNKSVSLGFGSLARPIDGYSKEKHYAQLPEILAKAFEGLDEDRGFYQSILNGAINGALVPGIETKGRWVGLKDMEKFNVEGIYPTNKDILYACLDFVRNGLKYDGPNGEFQNKIIGWISKYLGGTIDAPGLNGDYQINPNTIAKKNIIVNLDGVPEGAQQLFIATWTNYLNEYSQLEKERLNSENGNANARPFNNFVIIDEGAALTASSSKSSQNVQTLGKIAREGRKRGIAGILGTQDLGSVPDPNLDNANTVASFRVGSVREEIRANGRFKLQRPDTLGKLPVGTCYIKIGDKAPYLLRVDNPHDQPNRVDLVQSPDGYLFESGPSGKVFTKGEHEKANEILGSADWSARRLIGLVDINLTTRLKGKPFIGLKEVPPGQNMGDAYIHYNQMAQNPKEKRVFECALQSAVSKVVGARMEDLLRLNLNPDNIEQSIYDALYYHLSDPTGARRVPGLTESKSFIETVYTPGEPPKVVEKVIGPWLSSDLTPPIDRYDTPKNILEAHIKSIQESILKGVDFAPIDGAAEYIKEQFGITVNNTSAKKQLVNLEAYYSGTLVVVSIEQFFESLKTPGITEKQIQDSLEALNIQFGSESTKEQLEELAILKGTFPQLDPEKLPEVFGIMQEMKEYIDTKNWEVVKSQMEGRYPQTDELEIMLGHPVPGANAAYQLEFLQKMEKIVHDMSFRKSIVDAGIQIYSLAGFSDDTSMREEINLLIGDLPPHEREVFANFIFKLPTIGEGKNSQSMYIPDIELPNLPPNSPIEYAVSTDRNTGEREAVNTITTQLIGEIRNLQNEHPDIYDDPEKIDELIRNKINSSDFNPPILEDIRDFLNVYMEDPTNKGGGTTKQEVFSLYEEAIKQAFMKQVDEAVRGVIIDRVFELRSKGGVVREEKAGGASHTNEVTDFVRLLKDSGISDPDLTRRLVEEFLAERKAKRNLDNSES